MDDLAADAFPREWRSLLQDHPHENARALNRRKLEVVSILELATAIKAGEMFVTGSLSYDRFWDRLPPQSRDPAAMAVYAASQGWAANAGGLVQAVKEALTKQTTFFNHAVCDEREAYVRCGKDGRPIVSPVRAPPTPASALDLERRLTQRAVHSGCCMTRD